MSTARTPSQTLIWVHGLKWIAALLLGAVAFLGLRFVWNEWSANRELQSLRASAASSSQPELAAIHDLHEWLAKNTSRQQTQTWLDLNLELNSPYVKSQVGNLLMRTTDDAQDNEVRVAWAKTSPTQPLIAWRWKPDLLKAFVREQQPLLNRLHAFAEVPGLVDQPVQPAGVHTALPEIVSGHTVQLLYLAAEQAILDRDAETCLRVLSTMERLRSKFAYPIFGIVALGGQQELWRYAVLHDALDAELFDAPTRQQLLEGILSGPNLIAESEPAGQAVAMSKRLDEERKVQTGEEPWRERMLPSVRAALWKNPSLDSRSDQESSIANWSADSLMTWEHYRDTAAVRLGILVYLDRKEKLPESLVDLRTVGVGPKDWTADFLKFRRNPQPIAEFKYELKSPEKTPAVLALQRLDTPLASPPEIPLPVQLRFTEPERSAQP